MDEAFLDDQLLERFSRQLLLPDFTPKAQRRLFDARVAIVGLGGLGCLVATQLAAVGIGHLLLIDYDDIALSNLPRQLLYTEKDVGKKKVDIAKAKLLEMGKNLDVEIRREKLTPHNAEKLLKGSDLVIDALDNVTDKLILNDYVLKHKTFFVHGGAVGYQGAFMSVVPGKTACLRCHFPKAVEEQQNCATLGVSSALCVIIASFQVHEAIALLAGNESTNRGAYCFFDLKRYHLKAVSIRDTACTHLLE